MELIKDGKYRLFAPTREKGQNGFAYIDMIVKNGVAKAVLEWGIRDDGTEYPLDYLTLDASRLKESTTKELFDFAYEIQIDLDWKQPPHSNN